MISDSELDDVLFAWLDTCGITVRNSVCVPITGRKDLYKHLIKTLVESYQVSKEDLKGKVYRKIEEKSMPANSAKDKAWKKNVSTDWGLAINAMFPITILMHDSTNDAVQPVVEPVVYQKSPTQYHVEKLEAANKVYTEGENTPIDLNAGLKNPLDFSIFSDRPKIEYVVDEELVRMLRGIDEEETETNE